MSVRLCAVRVCVDLALNPFDQGRLEVLVEDKSKDQIDGEEASDHDHKYEEERWENWREAVYRY